MADPTLTLPGRAEPLRRSLPPAETSSERRLEVEPTGESADAVALRRLPRVDSALPPARSDPAGNDGHNPLFQALVTADDDLVGLLAYALYKQNKRDWLITFAHAHGRVPTDEETAAFITGERIERRLQTYRRLAEDLLAREAERRAGGNGAGRHPFIKAPQSAGPPVGAAVPARDPKEATSSAAPHSLRARLLVYAVSLALILGGLYMLGRLVIAWR